MNIRDATLEDLPSIIDFQRRMATETENITLDHDILREGAKRLLEDSSKGKYYVAENNGKAIGCLMTTFEWSEWRNGNVLWIQSVYVLESYRGQGVFKKLYAHIKQLALADPSLRGIRLYVDRNNLKAQQVYANLGMNGDHYQVYEWMKG